MKRVIWLHFRRILYPMYDNYNVTTCPMKIVTTYPIWWYFYQKYMSIKPLAHKAVLILSILQVYFMFLLCQIPVVAGYSWRKVNFRKCKKFTRRGKNQFVWPSLFLIAVYHLQNLQAELV